MKIQKILAVCLSTLFLAAAGCGISDGGKTMNSVGNSSPQTSAVTVAPSSSATSGTSSESTTATAIRVANVYQNGGAIYEADDSESALSAYQINGDTYLKLNDVSNLFKTKITYDDENHVITVGDATRANAVFYMPDLSAYPNLDETFNLPPTALRVDSGITDFKFLTKAVPFQNMMKKIDEKLKSSGFAAATEEQYTELADNLSEFKQGKMENTYFKSESDQEESAIQLIDGGLDKNKLPVIIVRMKAKSQCSGKDGMENTGDIAAGVSDAAERNVVIKNANVTAVKTQATVKYYNLALNANVYQINGSPYLNLSDISGLFHIKIIYDEMNYAVSIGDITWADAAYYMPDDLSQYPNPEGVIGLPPREVWTDEGTSGEVIDFKFGTKGVPFQDIMKKFDEKLKSEGFTVATEEQYVKLTMVSHISAFQQGKSENTYIQYKKGYEDFDPYTIQFIDGGLDENKLPIIIVKMLAG